jgi:hypothetical protein
LSDLSSRAFSASTTYSISLVSSYSEGWFAYYVNGELQQGRENEPIDFFEPQNETFWSIGIPETYEQYYFDPSVACQRNYCTRIYNRALTEDEVRYNWETDNYIYHIVP